MKKARYLADLDNDQTQAVTANINTPLVIKAGPGSGKTRTLICRIAFLLDQGIIPESILIITYTRKATEEIRERLSLFVGNKASQILVKTYHGFCYEVLRTNQILTDLPKGFMIADGKTKNKILKELLGVNPRDATPEMKRKIIPRYEEELLKQKKIDFDGLLSYTIKLFQRHPEVIEKYRRFTKVILVDEFQDTSEEALTVIKPLLSNSVTIAGDLNQSIYGFRGANPERCNDFVKSLKEPKTVNLERNYRSTGRIMNFCRSIIGKPLIENESADDGNVVKILRAKDETAEAAGIIREIERMCFPGSLFRLTDIVIMGRTRKSLSRIELELLRRGIKYTHRAGCPFLSRPAALELLAMMRLIASSSSDEDSTGIIFDAFKVASIGIFGFRHSWIVAIDDLRRIQKRPTMNPLTVLSLFLNGKAVTDGVTVPKIAKKEIKKMLDVINKINESIASEELPLSDSILEIGKEIQKLQKALREDAVDEDPTSDASALAEEAVDQRQETVRLLAEEADRFGKMHPFDGSPIKALVRFADFLAAAGCSASRFSGVTVSTIHQMKGLEAEVAFVAGIFEGGCPLPGADVDEERRILYVAVSRPRRALFVSFPESVGGTKVSPSQFLSGIDSRLYQLIEC